jgi:hypothetical protein
MVVRPFDWRDLVLLHRTRHRGVCLDSRLALTRGPQAVQNALVDAFVPGNRGALTLVMRSNNPDAQSAIGQLLFSDDRQQARIAYISPSDALDDRAGLQLLDGLARAAGERGVQMLVAEVGESDSHFEALRRAGFAIFARQRLWRLAQDSPMDDPSRAELWRPVTTHDYASIQSLYMNLVPALVQQVERPPVENPLGLMYCQDDEALGYLDVQHGPNGIWVQPYFHPAAALSDDLMAGFMHALAGTAGRPLYVCVRSYQGGLGGPLERLGLQPCADQAVMVKRLAARIPRALQQALPAMDGTRPEPTAPFASFEHHNPYSKTSSL